MDSNGSWQISEKDRMGRDQYDRMQGVNEPVGEVKCFRCRWKGHTASMCTNPKRVDVCHLCGERSHSEYFCDQKKCRRCFKPRHTGKCHQVLTKSSELCQRCRRWGHSALVCPDIWRQFHNTTDTKDVFTISVEQQRQTKRVFCCICATEGHFGYECHLVHPKEKLYIPLVAQYVNQSSSIERHAPSTSTCGSFSSKMKTSGDAILYRSAQLPENLASFWSLVQTSHTQSSTYAPHNDIHTPQCMHSEPWPAL